ncbi:MAG: hypothetical protein QG668_290 [Patescibacteria group bacterium]|nr:hypothetical protein [Patescibacteria group bacterium]
MGKATILSTQNQSQEHLRLDGIPRSALLGHHNALQPAPSDRLHIAQLPLATRSSRILEICQGVAENKTNERLYLELETNYFLEKTLPIKKINKVKQTIAVTITLGY